MVSREFLFIGLYGILVLTAAFLFAFWGWFAIKRYRKLAPRQARSDRYFLLASGLALDAGGGAIVFGFAIFANASYGLSRALVSAEGIGIAIGLLVMLASKVLFVWLADLEREPPVWTWLKWMGVLTIAWGLASFVIAGQMPDPRYNPHTHRVQTPG